MTGRTTWTGRREPPATAVTPEKLSLLVELLPTALSLRDVGAMLGLRIDQVRREAAPFLAIMKMAGIHPQCGCGRDRFHPYGCVDSYPKGKRHDGMPGHSFAQAGELVRRRALAIEMIKSGARWFEIDGALGMAKGSARKYLRFMSPEDRKARRHVDAGRRDELRRAKRSDGGPRLQRHRAEEDERSCSPASEAGRSLHPDRRNRRSEPTPMGIAA